MQDHALQASDENLPYFLGRFLQYSKSTELWKRLTQKGTTLNFMCNLQQ